MLDPTLAQQLSSHPPPFWVERMATAYVRCVRAARSSGLVQLLPGMAGWQPHGAGVVSEPGCPGQGLQHVSLEDARIRRLVQQLPRVVVTEPIPCVRFASLPAEVGGVTGRRGGSPSTTSPFEM